MNPGISIKKGENFVHASVHAPVSLELLAELMGATSEKAEKWGFSRYLIDFSNVEKTMGVFDDYDLAHKKARQYGLKPGTKHALIVRHEDIDGFRFVETAFRNAGYILKVFTEEDEALDWIRK